MKLKLKRPLVIIDFEATGKDPEIARIVQIGFKKIGADRFPVHYNALINPTIPIPIEATEIHNITDEMVKSKPKFTELANEVLEFISGCDLSGYNILGYDAPLLNAEFNRAGIIWDYSGINFVDSLRIAREMEPRNLDWASKFYCDVELDGAHDAASDSSAAGDILFAQVERYDTIPFTVEGLALFCNGGNKLLDLSGKFKYNEAGEIVFAFGKYEDELAEMHEDYLSWMLGSDFPADTKAVIRKMLI